MGEFSGSDLDLGGNYVSVGTDKNSVGYLLKICLFYNTFCRYKLKRIAYTCMCTKHIYRRIFKVALFLVSSKWKYPLWNN